MNTIDVSLNTIARRSPLLKYKTGALLVKQGKLLSAGWSHMGANISETYTVHAERHALARAKHLDVSGAICYTITLRGDRIFAAMPCKTCAVALLKAGIAICCTEGREYNITDIFDSLKLYSRPDAN